MIILLHKNIFSLFFFVISIGGMQTKVYSQPKVTIINVSELEKILIENNNQPLLINVWATWCAPCREEFPDLVKLSNDYKDQIKFIGISADDDEDLDEKVIPFLKSQNAQFENYLVKVSEPEDFINVLNKDWGGAIPATFIYDKVGKQKKMLIGTQSYEQFEQAIKKMIE